jgi:hypothetical protein
LKKLALVGKDLHKFSQETVQMFRRDALKSGYSLPIAVREVLELFPANGRRTVNR